MKEDEFRERVIEMLREQRSSHESLAEQVSILHQRLDYVVSLLVGKKESAEQERTGGGVSGISTERKGSVAQRKRTSTLEKAMEKTRSKSEQAPTPVVPVPEATNEPVKARKESDTTFASDVRTMWEKTVGFVGEVFQRSESGSISSKENTQTRKTSSFAANVANAPPVGSIPQPSSLQKEHSAVEMRKVVEKQEEPEEPEELEEPEEPAEPKVPKGPEVPKAPKVPKEPEVPKVPKAPKVPKEPEVPKVPKGPEEPEKQEISNDDSPPPGAGPKSETSRSIPSPHVRKEDKAEQPPPPPPSLLGEKSSVKPSSRVEELVSSLEKGSGKQKAAKSEGNTRKSAPKKHEKGAEESPQEAPSRLSIVCNRVSISRDDYASFVDRIESYAAWETKKTIRDFVNAFDERLVDDQERVHEFLSLVERKMEQNRLWIGLTAEEFSGQREAAEKYVLSRLHSKVFGRHSDAKSRDSVLNPTVQRLKTFLQPEHLEIPPEFADQKVFNLAARDIAKINRYKSPGEKLSCILLASDRLMTHIERNSSDCRGADDFLPLLIYSIVRSGSHSLCANVEFISRYRHPSRLVSEAGYFFTHFAAAVAFLEHFDPSYLAISEEEFAEFMRKADDILRAQSEGDASSSGSQTTGSTGSTGSAGNVSSQLLSAPVDATKHRSSGQYSTSSYTNALLSQDPPKTVSSWMQLAMAYTINGQYEEAKNAYGKASEMQPENPSIFLGLGMVHESTGEWEHAKTCYERTLELHPDNVSAMYALSKALDHLGKPVEAEEARRRVNQATAERNGQNERRPSASLSRPASASGKPSRKGVLSRLGSYRVDL